MDLAYDDIDDLTGKLVEEYLPGTTLGECWARRLRSCVKHWLVRPDPLLPLTLGGVPIRKVVAFAAAVSDERAFYLPILTRIWRRAGFDVLVLLVDDTSTHSHSHWLVRKELSRAGALVESIPFSNCSTQAIALFSQLFAAYHASFGADDYLLTANHGYLPTHLRSFSAVDWSEEVHLHAGSLKCTSCLDWWQHGDFRKTWTARSWYVGAKVQTWREIVRIPPTSTGRTPWELAQSVACPAVAKRNVLLKEALAAPAAEDYVNRKNRRDTEVSNLAPFGSEADDRAAIPTSTAFRHCGLGWSQMVDTKFTEYLTRWSGFDRLHVVQPDISHVLPGQSSVSTVQQWFGSGTNDVRVDWKLPLYGRDIGASAPVLAALNSSGFSTNDMVWASNYLDLFSDSLSESVCDTYLSASFEGPNPSFSRLLDGYNACHQLIITGGHRSATQRARLLVFRHGDKLGWGNVVFHLSAAFLLSVLLRRAFVIDHASWGNDLRAHLAHPSFEWDLDEVKQALPDFDSLNTAQVGMDCSQLYDDSAEVLILSVRSCMEIHQLAQEPHFQKLRSFFPSRSPASILGLVSRLLFQPGPFLEHDLSERRRAFAGKEVVGLAIRNGGFSVADVMRLTQDEDSEMIDVFGSCAGQLLQRASERGQEAIVFAVSDRPETMQPVRERLGSSVYTPHHIPVHSIGDFGKSTEFHQTLLDWFTLGEASDAVITHHSSFHVTAYARTGRTAVSINTLQFMNWTLGSTPRSIAVHRSTRSDGRAEALKAHARGDLCERREFYTLNWETDPKKMSR
jgi:hypothetical protein